MNKEASQLGSEPREGGRMKYRLIDASAADEAWLDGLRRRAYADLFTATWDGWDEARHLRHFSQSMRDGQIAIIELDGTRVGMIQLRVDGGTLEIREIQIDPRHQGQGIGTSVLQDVISRASGEGQDVRLSVGLKNERAIRLYERLGFVSVGKSKTHRHMSYEAAG
jgi:ribosomal protein S18 acetylase RimI-like enzyme